MFGLSRHGSIIVWNWLVCVFRVDLITNGTYYNGTHRMLRAINTFCAAGGCVVTVISTFSHLKNYRKPMDQRLIVRILLLVPFFAASAWCKLYMPRLGTALSPLRDLYEAFVIYTFFTLLTNLLGGERNLIFMATGKAPLRLVWPLDLLFGSIDISDPQTFVIVKRCLMQYVWARPILTLLSLIFSDSIWLTVTIAYNISLTLALNALTVFWLCVYDELKPFRVIFKFLSIKLVVFFSYWQVLGIEILHALHVLPPSVEVSMVSNTLLCVETFIFAFIHWFAFSYTDYATTKFIGFGRLPIFYAIKDAFGIQDLVMDFRSAFMSDKYNYREFDSVEAVMDHPASRSRYARLNYGLRYQNQGKSKYWLPTSRASFQAPRDDMMNYGAVADLHNTPEAQLPSDPITWQADDLVGDEPLYTKARGLPGDCNYPVITVRESLQYVPIAQRGNSENMNVILRS